MTDELKPCPFCGCDPNWHTIRMVSPRRCRHFLSCDGGICLNPSTQDFAARGDAIDAWNVRTDHPLDKTIARLKQELDGVLKMIGGINDNK